METGRLAQTRIYIVEDSELIKQRINRLVSFVEGIEIAGCSDNIDEAVETIKNSKPEVVILDISVEKVKGLKMISNLKRLEPSPKVIMFTNYDFENYRQKSFEFGADFYLDKSQDFELLSSILEEIRKNHVAIDLVESL